MSRLSHSNPELDDVLHEGSEYEIENAKLKRTVYLLLGTPAGQDAMRRIETGNLMSGDDVWNAAREIVAKK